MLRKIIVSEICYQLDYIIITVKKGGGETKLVHSPCLKMTKLVHSPCTKISLAFPSVKKGSRIGVEILVKLSKFYGIPVSAMLKEAGFIENHEDGLPELGGYLRAKYRLSPQAIRDMEMAKKFVDKKYPKK